MKKINKKIIMFGVLGVFAMVLVSAALVAYISNDVSGTATISSPLTFEVSTTGYSSMSSVANFGIINGGQTETLYTRITNNANTPLTGSSVIITISDSVNNAVDCNEISHIVARDAGGIAVVTGWTIGFLECIDNGDDISIVTAPVVLTENGGSYYVQEMSFDITFAVNMQPSVGYSYTGEVLY